MAEDLDVEAMLEAPYKKEEEGGGDDSHRSSKSKSSRDKDRDRDKKKRSGSKDRKRSRSRDRKRSRDGDRTSSRGRDRGDRDRGDRADRRRSRSRDRDRDRERRRSRSRERRRRSRSRSRGPPIVFPGPRQFGRPRRSWSRSPLRLILKNPEPEMTPEERDARTVFCMQLSARIRPRDLEEFFSSVGKVRDVRLITDNKTRRSKGISYVEFKDTESVPLAMGLSGQKLLGIPIIVQASQAEKNRLANAQMTSAKGMSGPMRLYVGSLHFNITEDMLKGIFEPFGKIDHINLMMDSETGRSKGYGFVTFHDAEDAKKALEQLNGFELAGRPMKVGHVTERTLDSAGGSALDSDEMDRAGIDLGATGRLQLMAKLAEGTGFELPPVAANALNMTPAPPAVVGGVPGAPPAAAPAAAPAGPATAMAAPPIATQCFMLSNMFDPTTETSMNWDVEVRDDVIEECNKHGGVLHIYVDKASPQGNVYVKCPSIAAAVASVQALHGRWFAGKVITAAYVPLPNYHSLFPDAARAATLLMPSTAVLRQAGGIQPSIAPMYQ